MKASRQRHISKKRLRTTTVVEPDIPKDQVVNIEEYEDIDWTDSEEEADEVGESAPKAQKKETTKGKGRESVSTRGPGSQVKKRKTDKSLTRDQRLSLLRHQKVLNGRVFEPTTKDSAGMRELVDAVKD